MTMFRSTLSRWGAVVALLVLIGGVALVMGWTPDNPTPAQAATDETVSPASLQRVTSRLEALHQRAVARSTGDDDDKSEGHDAAARQKITPERAAQLAVQSKGGGHPTRIDRRTATNGKPYYEVQVESSSGPGAVPRSTLRVDSETGNVTAE